MPPIELVIRVVGDEGAPVEVCRQHKGVVVQPLHHFQRLLLLVLVDLCGLQAVREVPVQVYAIGVLSADSTPEVTCQIRKNKYVTVLDMQLY